MRFDLSRIPSVTGTSVIPMVSFAPTRSVEATDGLFACEQCGTTKKRVRCDQRFCSSKCRLKYADIHDPRRRVCDYCQRPFTPDASTKIVGPYCGKRCKAWARARDNPVTCVVCQTQFIIEPKTHYRKYCSRKCRTVGFVRSFAKTKPPRRPDGKVGPTANSVWLLETAPEGSKLDRWFASLTDEQLRSVWVAAVVEQFGEGRRAELSEALRTVRRRLQAVQSDSDAKDGVGPDQAVADAA